MTEEEAKAALDVPRETMERLEDYAALLEQENLRQNLVSKGSLGALWSRHIFDSAQLLRFSPAPAAKWLDLGSGAGFPGLIVAAMHRGEVTLVESRRLRAEFLQKAAEVLGVAGRVDILCSPLERLEARPFEVISARAFAPLDRLFELGERFSTDKTRWILPKGRQAQSELDAARTSWQGEFRLEPSLTDPEARIIVAEQVRRKPRGKKAR